LLESQAKEWETGQTIQSGSLNDERFRTPAVTYDCAENME